MASVRQTMELLNVSRTTMLKWLAEDRFPDAVKAEGLTGGWDIPRDNVEAVRQQLIDDLQEQIEDLRERGLSPLLAKVR